MTEGTVADGTAAQAGGTALYPWRWLCEWIYTYMTNATKMIMYACECSCS